MGKNLIEQALDILQNYVNCQHAGNRRAASIALGMGSQNSLLGKWLKRERVPSMSSLAPILEKLGVGLSMPTPEPDREVCFVNARIVPAGESVEPPQAEDYIAAPLVGEVGAGPGYVPQDEIKSWFLAYKHLPAVRHRRNLLAVELGNNSDSMLPTLAPGDIVLIDRDDRNVDQPGRMMLVLDPDGAGMIKRVSVQTDGNDFRVTLYSDNATKHPPMVYSLRSDYLDDWDRVIVGRAIWAWSDIREK